MIIRVFFNIPHMIAVFFLIDLFLFLGVFKIAPSNEKIHNIFTIAF